MKKLLYVLVLCALVFPFVSHAALLDGCQVSYKFSPLTGQSCSQVQACAPGDLFSTVTGQSCSSVPTFPDGCTSYTGYSSTTGKKCDGSTPVQQQINQIQTQVNQIIHTLPSLILPSNTGNNQPDNDTGVPKNSVLPPVSVNTTPSISATIAMVTCIANNSLSNSSIMTCDINYSITANNITAYVPQASSLLPNDTSSIGVKAQSSRLPSSSSLVNGNSLNISVSDVQNGTTAVSSPSGSSWMIDAGHTANFTAIVVINDTDNSNSGLYRAFVASIPWSTDDSGTWSNIYTSGIGPTSPGVSGYSQLN